MLRNANAPDCTTRARNAKGSEGRRFITYTFENRLDTKSFGEFAHACNRRFATFTDNICCAEFFCKFDSAGVAIKQNDLLCTEAFGGNHTAQANCPATDNSHGLAGTNPGGHGCMVARCHHIGQGDKRGHQRMIFAYWKRKECAIRPWDTHCLPLSAIKFCATPKTSIQTGRLQPFLTIDAGSI